RYRKFDNDRDWTRKKLEACIKGMIARRIDITGGYKNWLAIGFGLADEIGKAGEQYFYEISQYHPEYNRINAEQQYRDCLKYKKGGNEPLAHMFSLFREYGIRYMDHLENIHTKPPK